jgi:hypothetical protein
MSSMASNCKPLLSRRRAKSKRELLRAKVSTDDLEIAILTPENVHYRQTVSNCRKLSLGNQYQIADKWSLSASVLLEDAAVFQ